MKTYRTTGQPVLLQPELQTSNSSDNCNWRRRYWARGHHKFQLSLVNRERLSKKTNFMQKQTKKGKGKGRAKNDMNTKIGKGQVGKLIKKDFVSVLYQKL